MMIERPRLDPESSPRERLFRIIEWTFRRVKTEEGHAPDVADVLRDLEPALRIEILLLQLREVQQATTPARRAERIKEIISELALVNMQMFRT